MNFTFFPHVWVVVQYYVALLLYSFQVRYSKGASRNQLIFFKVPRY